MCNRKKKLLTLCLSAYQALTKAEKYCHLIEDTGAQCDFDDSERKRNKPILKLNTFFFKNITRDLI